MANLVNHLQVESAALLFDLGTSGAIFDLPDGATNVSSVETQNLIVEPSHPIATGVDTPFDGISASLDYFTNLPPGATVVATTPSGDPTAAVSLPRLLEVE